MNWQAVFYLCGCAMFCWIAWMYTKILCTISAENAWWKQTKYIRLDEEDFACLVRGGCINYASHKNGVFAKIMLQDIGFLAMENALEKAQDKQDTYVDHNKIEM